MAKILWYNKSVRHELLKGVLNMTIINEEIFYIRDCNGLYYPFLMSGKPSALINNHFTIEFEGYVAYNERDTVELVKTFFVKDNLGEQGYGCDICIEPM